MTSPHTSTLLNESVDAAAPRAPQHVRSVTHVVPQQVPVMAYPQQFAPAPAAPRGGSGAVSTLVMALLVVLVGIVALVGAWYLARESAPTSREAGLTQGMAMRQSFQNGRERGVVDGRSQALQGADTIAALRVAQAREQAYAAAYRRGLRAGRSSYRAPRYSGGTGYRAPRISSVGSGELYSAFGSAQALANATGAPVDIEVY